MKEDASNKITEEEIVKKLEEFIYQNTDLEELENYSNNLNIFECIGMINQELQHSNFLAWLFNPSGNHCLGDYFVKEFLKMVLFNQKENNLKNDLTIFDIDNWNSETLKVSRENNNIDILFFDEQNKFVCVIENKISTKQHSNQLERYKEYIEKKHPEYKKLYIYLKPTEDEKIDKSYTYVSYQDINELICRLIDNKKETLNDTLLLVINNYKELLEKNIMGKDKIREICEKIYAKHGVALDTIFNKIDAFSGGFDLCQIAVADLIKKFIESSQEYKLLCKKETVRNILITSESLEKYKDNFKFRIWNAIMDKDFALVIDFNNIDKEKKIKICKAFTNRDISDSQTRVSLGKILTAQECNSCYDSFFKKNNELSDEWQKKIINSIKNKLNEDKLKRILMIMEETEC